MHLQPHASHQSPKSSEKHPREDSSASLCGCEALVIFTQTLAACTSPHPYPHPHPQSHPHLHLTLALSAGKSDHQLTCCWWEASQAPPDTSSHHLQVGFQPFSFICAFYPLTFDPLDVPIWRLSCRAACTCPQRHQQQSSGSSSEINQRSDVAISAFPSCWEFSGFCLPRNITTRCISSDRRHPAERVYSLQFSLIRRCRNTA